MNFELPALIYAAGLIFARLGAILMLMPSMGEPSIPPRIRLAFALLFALALGPVIAPSLPPMPDQPMMLIGLVVSELLIGLMIGAISRMLLTAAAIAGQVIGMQSGLAMAQSFDPTQGQQGALMGAFLNLLFIALIFATNLHHLLFQAARGSYMVFPAGEIPLVADAAQWALDTFIDAFRIGVQIAAPLIVFGLIFYLALGVLSRLMPQAQIFFIAMPSNIMAGFFIVAIWLDRMEQFAMELR